MIIDLERFLISERPFWKELEKHLARLEDAGAARLDLATLKRFHYLYQRVSADLARVATFSAEPQVRGYLESLVSRAYQEIHEARLRPHRLNPWGFLTRTFPRAFRKHARAFWLATLIMLAGATFGGLSLLLDPGAKAVVLPAWPHLQTEPAERVAQEESSGEDRSGKTTFSAWYFQNNTRVAIFTLALGMTWGIGTIIGLFYNGVILGAVALDYVRAGQTRFLLGWLLPHGVIEIPAILIAGQAGLVLAAALIGRRDREPLWRRLRKATPDLSALIAGVAVLLLWAGFVEAFLSQYHEPVLPYALKIGFGAVELALLGVFLFRSGLKERED
ncbi:MAG: stage II sporulation protein M [Acidobacteriota bacterium]